jgi:hypothetical protein
MRTAAAATALGITLSIAALASCANPRPGEMPVPAPSVTPVFASEEEALAAAGDAYQRFLAVVDALGHSGWRDTSKLSEVARDQALETELENAEEFAAKGWVQVGLAAFDSMTLQQLTDGGPGSVELSTYVCLVVDGVDVVDAEGISVVAADRPPRQPFELTFNDVDGNLKLSRSLPWSGNNFC